MGRLWKSIKDGWSYLTQTFEPKSVSLFEATPYVGIEEEIVQPIKNYNFFPTIFSGPLVLPEDKKCKVFDIAGREVEPEQLKPGIYFIEIEDQIIKKVIKIK